MTPGVGACLPVTCVIPVHNGVRTVRRAIRSVLDQTAGAIDVLVVDDGSTDGSAAIVAEYGGRVRCLGQACRGPAAARNTGVGAAGGEYVAFLDQDDWWALDKIERQLARFAARGGLEVSVGLVESVWEGSTPARTSDQPRAGAVPGYVAGTMLARRSAFEAVGGFSEHLWFMDSLDWFARARDRRIVIELLPDVLLFHAVHGGNLSRRGSDSRAEALRVLKASLDRRRLAPDPHR